MLTFTVFIWVIMLVAILCVLFFVLSLLLLDIKKFNPLKAVSEKRKQHRLQKYLYEGTINKQAFLDRLDIMIERAGLSTVFPWLTAEVLIGVSFLLAVLGSYLVVFFSSFWLFGFFTFFYVFLFIYLTLRLIARRVYDKIDNQLPVYINVMCNFCSTNTDIVDIFEKSSNYLSFPLRSYIEQFIFETKRGVELEKAFEHLEAKIESKRFKHILKNLYICSKHEANYREILEKSRVLMNFYFVEKARRNKAVVEGRSAIIVLLVLGLFLMYMVNSFSPSVFFNLRLSLVGNLIAFYMISVLFYSLFKLLTLDKLEL